jgi:hypothetical protein
MRTHKNIAKRSTSRSSEYLPALELMKGCATEELPKCGGEQERWNAPAAGAIRMESGGERMVRMHIAASSGGGAEALMTENAPTRATVNFNVKPADNISPGEARTISLAPSAAWASEDAIMKNTAQAKEPPTTIWESETWCGIASMTKNFVGVEKSSPLRLY